MLSEATILSGTVTRLMSNPAKAATIVPTITAISGAGTTASCLGLNWFQIRIAAMVATPVIAAR